ncbi:MAG: GAF domain-containing sensor histidine kinase [Anaerolineae bacterium]|nr:GAF domain-containing sensor histidine kinase [Anaerolineae bacterium]
MQLVLLLGALALLGLLRLGHVNRVAVLLILLVEGLVLWGNLGHNRSFNTAEIACVLIIIFAGALGDKRMVIFATAASVVVVTITLLVWRQNPLPEVELNRLWLDWMAYTTLFIISGCLSYVLLRSIYGALGKVQDSERLLEKQNRELAREIAERRQAEQKQQLVAASLRGVLNCASEMLACETEDQLWKKAVEMAREQLGIERCAIFVRDMESGDLVGTYGTDLQRRTTDERKLRFAPIDPIWQMALPTLRTPSQWVANHETRLFEMSADGITHREIGVGWMVLTPISARDNVPFALMSNDCAITQRLLDNERQDLLAVFCSLLGNILERKHLETQLQGEAGKLAAQAERSRLARELHDSVSQALFGIALGARTAQEQLNHPSDYSRERVAAPINYVLDLSQAALAEMRALIFELRPESLQTEGLIAAFEKQAAALHARHRIVVNTSLGEHEPPLDMARKEALYRIGLEAIQNTIKHARATQVDLCLSVEPTQVTMNVRDNGRGFNTADEFPGHLGLQTMRERAEEFGGTFAVISQPDQGTSVQVVLPIAKNANGHEAVAG